MVLRPCLYTTTAHGRNVDWICNVTTDEEEIVRQYAAQGLACHHLNSQSWKIVLMLLLDG